MRANSNLPSIPWTERERAEFKRRLAALEAGGGGGGGATDLGYTQSTRVLTSSTGTDVTLPLATDTLPGLMSAADKAAVDTGSLRISREFIGSNTRSLISALKVTSGRFSGLWRERDLGDLVPYFAFAAMTLAPDMFLEADRQECCAAAIDRCVVGPRQNTAAYGQFTLVQFASGKIYFANIAGTSAGSEPSDAGVTTKGDFLGDGTITWEYTGLQVPTTWQWHILNVDTGLVDVAEADSHDAYAGMLAAAASAANVDATWLSTASAHPGFDRMEVIDKLIETCMTDQLDGSSPGPRLTYTFQDGVDTTGSAYTIQFLADNVEVYAGYKAQVALRTIAGLSTTAAEQNAADVKEGVFSLHVGGQFQIYQGQDPAHLALSGDGDFAVVRFRAWPALYGMLETLAEWQDYGDAVIADTVASTPGLFSETLDTFPMSEWFYAADKYFHLSEARDALRWRVTSRNVANVTIVDAALTALDSLQITPTVEAGGGASPALGWVL